MLSSLPDSDVIQLVRQAFLTFGCYEQELFFNERPTERPTVFRLALYLQQVFALYNLVVDCEYNRYGTEPKVLISDANLKGLIVANGLDEGYLLKTKRRIFPDIVVHRRRTDINVLCVEAKLSRFDEKDSLKLCALTHGVQIGDGLQIKYQIGLQIKLGMNELEVPAEARLWKDGSIVNPLLVLPYTLWKMAD